MSNDWLIVLKEEIARTSMRKAAVKLNYSATTLCMIINGRYPGGTDKIRAAVEAVLMNRTVTCPILDEIPVPRCRDQAAAPFNSNNAQNIALYRACRVCTNNQNKDKHHGN
jgi:hypothetical protein